MKRYVLLMACAAMIAACQTPTEEENQEDPTPVPEEEVTETQIPEEGGTVTEGDISVDIPQGTFTGGGAIAVVPTTQGSTLGAGDTFKAGCVYGLLHGMKDDELVRFASACSAIAISRFPLPLNPPKPEEVQRLIRGE